MTAAAEAGCEQIFRGLYTVYEWLRDSPAIEESSTSRNLHRTDGKRFVLFESKLMEEVGELCGVADGTHNHSGNTPKQDFLMESNQVWYWLAMNTVSRRIHYPEINPHEHVQAGYDAGFDEDRPLVRLSNRFDTIGTAGTCMRFIGATARKFEAEPAEIAAYDLAEMKKKIYLNYKLRRMGLM
jgi:hypothetical protein